MGKAFPDGASQALTSPCHLTATRKASKTPRFAMRCSLQGEAVVNLPRALNNAGHGRLLLARRVKSFQAVHPFFDVTYCVTSRWMRI